MKHLLKTHKEFWTRTNDTPLLLVAVAQEFPLFQFAPMKRLMASKPVLEAADLNVAEYAGDYERQWMEAAGMPGSTYWAARPVPGVPWLEGALGCAVHAVGSDLWAHWPERDCPSPFVPAVRGRLWRDKYLEFIRSLQFHAAGRYPVAQAILRGPSDAAGAILGGGDLVLGFLDRPVLLRSLLAAAVETLLDLVRSQWSLVPPFHRGYIMGGFGLWCPERCLVFQEDLTSVLSPAIYRDFLWEFDRALASAFPYSGMHLHQSSLFLLDQILDLAPLRLVQITCDEIASDLGPLAETARAVLARKNLILSGFFSRRQLLWLAETLPSQGLALQALISTPEEAAALAELF